MIVFATKISVRKVALGVAALCAVVRGIAALSPHAVQSVSAPSDDLAQKLNTNEERVFYLRSFGWEPVDAPEVEMEVQIPKEFDAAYEEYNGLQQRQGLDLTKYRGKRAKLYTYTLQNYPTGQEGVTASLVLYKDRVIAADISSPETDGFIHGLLEAPPSGGAAK